MTHDTLRWLAEFQQSFGRLVRTPLASGSGQLQAELGAYAPELCAAVRGSGAQRLAVYNRQYWFRLLGVLQKEYPLLSGLMGAWSFNLLAMRFLSAQPPRHHDLARVTDGFEAFLAAAGETSAWQEAAWVDTAYRRVFFAPSQSTAPPLALDLGTLAALRLQLSAACVIVEQHWPWVQLRPASRARQGVTQPEPLPAPQYWAIVRHPAGVGQRALEPQQAQLYALLARERVVDALERLEASCPEAELERLPERVQFWLSEAVRERWLLVPNEAAR